LLKGAATAGGVASRCFVACVAVMSATVTIALKPILCGLSLQYLQGSVPRPTVRQNLFWQGRLVYDILDMNILFFSLKRKFFSASSAKSRPKPPKGL
jgi:hypothetical protein